jgi:hypothetical protein
MLRRLAVLAALLSASPLAAQDSYQWSEVYGTQATLLGGIVVGAVPDLSATYYNPGRLAAIKDPGLALASHTYEYRTLKLKVEQTTFEGTDEANVAEFNLTPSFVAGVLPLGGGHSTIAYTILTRQSGDYRFDIREEGANPPGGTEGSQQALAEATASETWAGVSWAYRLGARLGIGATGFIATRSQRQRQGYTVQTLTGGIPDATGEIVRQFSYSDWRALLKIGLSARAGNVDFGATVTTPGLHLYGSGDALYSESYTQQGDPAAARYAWRDQQDIPSHFNSPWSLSAGASWRLGSSTIHSTVEWSAALGYREVLDADPVVPEDGRAPFESDLTFARDAIFNWGVGFEHRFRPKFAAYAYVASDRTARAKDEEVNLTFASWDRWHTGGGASFTLGRLDLVAGLSYNGGGREISSLNDPAGAPIPGVTSASISERYLRMLLAFELTF